MSIKTIYVQAGGGFDNVVAGISEPRAPEAGEITVRIRASSLNYHDLGVVSGATPPTEQRIPMSDGAGEVIAVGAGVSEFAVGDHVVSTFFLTGLMVNRSLQALAVHLAMASTVLHENR